MAKKNCIFETRKNLPPQMKVHFSKYEGAGNDFILIDNRLQNYNLNHSQIQFLCDRHFGIGADGVIILENEDHYNFRMKYYNSDGFEGTMCGNGGRCITHFAYNLQIIQNKACFKAIDGVHYSEIVKENIVRLKMQDVSAIEEFNNAHIINTGSPHYVQFVPNVDQMDVYKNGKEIRNLPAFRVKGVNVNFAEEKDENIKVRTYERGVENETLSCGTGAVATALVYALKKDLLSGETIIKNNGGTLKVSFNRLNNSFYSIWLEGPVRYVFMGNIEI